MLKIHLSNGDLDYMIPKGISPKYQILYFRNGNKKIQGDIFVVLIWKYESPVL